MANPIPKQNPLPADYVRPSLAEFKAAGLNPDHYNSFFEGHEGELRKYAVPAVAAPSPVELVDADPSLELEPAWQYERDERGNITGGGPPAGDPVEPSVDAESTEPAAVAAPPASAAVRALPADYVRPSLEQFLALGYLKRTPPDERQAAYVKFFEEYELARYGTTASAPPAPAVSEAPWQYERDERGNITGGGPPATPANSA